MKFLADNFPNLTDLQLKQFEQLEELYKDWNSKINVISRKDIDNLYPRHVFHSLTVAKIMEFKDGADILDLGCGGGFPGIPLAILLPNVKFTLVDGTRKKITVVQEVAKAIGLTNLTARHVRAEELKTKYDFVICRAVASLDKLCGWAFPLLKRKHQHIMPNGLLTLKGGNIKEEAKSLNKNDYYEVFPIEQYFEGDDYFKEKCLVYVQGWH